MANVASAKQDKLTAGATYDSGWVYPAIIDDATKVSKSGDTMSGALTVPTVQVGTFNNGHLQVNGNMYVTDVNGNNQKLVMENDDYSWRGRLGNGDGGSPAAGIVSTDGSGVMSRISGTASQVVLGNGGLSPSLAPYSQIVAGSNGLIKSFVSDNSEESLMISRNAFGIQVHNSMGAGGLEVKVVIDITGTALVEAYFNHSSSPYNASNVYRDLVSKQVYISSDGGNESGRFYFPTNHYAVLMFADIQKGEQSLSVGFTAIRNTDSAAVGVLASKGVIKIRR